MIKAGITGGIGSGKTYVCRVFENLGVPVFYADAEGKKISSNAEVSDRIIHLFGSRITDEKKNVDRKKLGDLVFNDPAELQKLNALIHPLVKTRFEEWALQHHDKPYVLKEAAILFESGSNKGLDKVITIASPLPSKMERLQKRDRLLTDTEIEKRMLLQWGDEQKIKLSDYVIHNEPDSLLLPQILHIHGILEKM